MVRNGCNCLKYITILAEPVRDRYSRHHGKRLETIHIFSGNVSHKEMVAGLSIWETEDILGAGFVSNTQDSKFHCWGESETLGLKSRDTADTLLANELMFGYRD